MAVKRDDDRDAAAGSPTRRFTIIAQDPSVRRDGKILMAEIEVPAERLLPGPTGHRVQVVDYNATRREFGGSHVLPQSVNEEPKAWRDGRPSIVSDKVFQAQNVYALVMRTLARFEFALGRRIEWSFDTHQIKVAPHGLEDANAFYSVEDEGLVFGSFTGTSGAEVHTCLSHDIIVHETTHALLDALRERYMDPSGPDQAAFHEGFADVVALLSVFALPKVVEHLLLGSKRLDETVRFVTLDEVQPPALRASALFALAKQMGSELEGIRGQSLRRSAEITPDPTLKDSKLYREEHTRGELFVASVLHGFISAWSRRIIESGMPGQTRFPVLRAAEEGADIADALATMWIRAIDYMPPVHLEFGDALSAALTADIEVRPDDSRYHLRDEMRRSFAAFGFVPASKGGGADGAWVRPTKKLKYDRVRFGSMQSDRDEVFRFLWENQEALGLRRPGAYTEVLSVWPSTRFGPDGFIVRETVVTCYQVARLTPDEMRLAGVVPPPEYVLQLREFARADLGEEEGGDESSLPMTPLYGGAALIFDEYGQVKYWIHKDVFGDQQSARVNYLWSAGMLKPARDRARLTASSLSAIHRMRALGTRHSLDERW